MRRTLMLDEDDLIMVVKDDIVKQIDDNRGELNRTEFVNYLIHCQLQEYYNQKEYIEKDEFQRYTSQIMELIHNFLQFFVSYGMSMQSKDHHLEIQSLSKQLEAFYKPDKESGIA